MKRWLVLGVGFFVIGMGLAFTGTPTDPIGAFTLAISENAANGSLGGVSFRLSGAGLGSYGVIENDTEQMTALGYQALFYQTGFACTAIGYKALAVNNGGCNTACGTNALLANRSGGNNVAVGEGAMLLNTTGGWNLAVGTSSMWQNTEGICNTAVGSATLSNLTGLLAQYNTALGYGAGINCKSGAYNIYVGANVGGEEDENFTIRIGGQFAGASYRTFIAGIVDFPMTAEAEPAVVGIAGNGQLGTIPAELLPPGPKGDKGEVGATGPPGEGLVSGSILMLPADIAPPTGYNFLGSTNIVIKTPGGRANSLTINIYQKQ